MNSSQNQKEIGIKAVATAVPKNNNNMISIYSAILFFVIASPFLFKLVNQVTVKVAGLSIIDSNGLPNMVGLGLHALVFLLIMKVSLEKLL
jgi:hypothetical protein